MSVTQPSSIGTKAKKRKSGIPSGNAGEYFVMGELLRQGFDAQLADRNTKNYDVLVGSDNAQSLRKVQIKTVRSPPWYVRTSHFSEPLSEQFTVYVLLGNSDKAISGPAERSRAVRYFIAKNARLASFVHKVGGWNETAFMPLRAIEPFEDRWCDLLTE